MKTELCQFSGLKILPGHGKRYVRVDGRVLNFLNGKCCASYLMRRNPRKTCWTVLYRRKHKKGTEEEVKKKRVKRSTKFQRGIQGASLDTILAKKNQKPEVRRLQREQQIRNAKEKANAKKAAKTKAASQKAPTHKQKATKVTKAQAPRVGGKR